MSNFKISDGIVIGSNGIIFSDGSTQTKSTANASNIDSGTLSAVRLSDSGVTANTYGSSSSIPVITVDEKGRLTSVTTASVSSSGAGVTYLYKTSNYTMSSAEIILTNTTGSAFTLTLPATPSVGDFVEIVDIGDYWDVNNLTVGRNGSSIEGLDEDLLLDVIGAHVTLVYANSTWNVYAAPGGVQNEVPTETSVVQTATALAIALGG